MALAVWSSAGCPESDPLTADAGPPRITDTGAGPGADGGAPDHGPPDAAPADSETADRAAADGGLDADIGADTPPDAGARNRLECTSNADCAPVLAPLGSCEAPLCEDGRCFADALPNGTPCDDADPCTAGDVCTLGQCAGEARVCDDANQCTDDACEGDGCVATPRAGPCDDGDPCTGPDACQEGICRGAPVACPMCATDGDCVDHDDGDPCNGLVRCLSGQCSVDPATIPSCELTVTGPCEVAVCAPESGACVAAPRPDGAPCPPTSPCLAVGSCMAGACAAAPKACEDGNPCTLDGCDDASGCTHVGVSGPACDDGDACTGPDQCDAGACTGPLLLPCDDGNPCTTDSCDLGTGACLNVASGGPCDDGDACTAGDHCVDGTCVVGPVTCNDANACTTDACDPATGCTNIPIDCSDGDPCTEETCEPASGCVAVPPGAPCATNVDCYDNFACTKNWCNGCGLCAQAPLVCDDGNDCTHDTCVEPSGCRHDAVEGVCDDGDPCTVEDTCVAGVCSGAGSCPLGTVDAPASSCREILEAGHATGSGVYYLASSFGPAPFPVYCEMELLGGGWMRVANVRAEIPICSYVDGHGAVPDLVGDTATTGIMALQQAATVPVAGAEILVARPGTTTVFASDHPAFGWAQVAGGSIHPGNVASFGVTVSLDGEPPVALKTPPSCIGAPCLLAGGAPAPGVWSVVIGIGAFKSGTFAQTDACLSTGLLYKGIYTGSAAASAGWGGQAAIYIR